MGCRLLTWAVVLSGCFGRRLGRRGLSAPLRAAGQPGTHNCTVHWHTQPLDHFSFVGDAEIHLRYFVYEGAYVSGGPVFFYTGNEANVELYVNATGLMWESAQRFGAKLVFAEHRFYGESLPINNTDWRAMPLAQLTHEQALADFASLIRELTKPLAVDTAVIAFGGSYGGMLAAWLRMKYPALVDGAIAASAPILAFGAFDTNAYWRVVTTDASPQAGAHESCAANVRRAWPVIFKLGSTAPGLARLRQILRICPRTGEDRNSTLSIAMLAANAFDTLAMGNFPYASNYLVFQQTGDAEIVLPPWPVRVACARMAADDQLNAKVAANETLDGADEDSLLSLLLDATNVLNNASGAVACFDEPLDLNFDGIWDYQYCTEMLPQETYFATDGAGDMFWPRSYDLEAITKHCRKALGVSPRPEWIETLYGGAAVGGASWKSTTNIVFSNGLLDPWSAVGVLESLSDSVIAVVIPQGAHHLDLFFSHASDPPSVLQARKDELSQVERWVAAKKRR
ncbi:peptidase S28 [Pelagophyceae sp. CCMP2097]|nr:peptidase S28 [Pelagophyceae sp. CCMP2097]|mmetsp:Transcript_21170/g.73246  ORF Transcript_21170/g.73246 Transcript_21170/m.73246 type:complete len:512 (-) Transcript_21170:66-1601(-)